MWDARIHILENIPQELIISHLEHLNIGTGKRYHFGLWHECHLATYLLVELSERLSLSGFGNFRRPLGGFSPDFDHDLIEAGKYAIGKFDEGGLRYLAQVLENLIGPDETMV